MADSVLLVLRVGFEPTPGLQRLRSSPTVTIAVRRYSVPDHLKVHAVDCTDVKRH